VLPALDVTITDRPLRSPAADVRHSHQQKMQQLHKGECTFQDKMLGNVRTYEWKTEGSKDDESGGDINRLID